MILTVTLNAAVDKRYVSADWHVDAVNRVQECMATPGGKGLNVAKVAKLAGEDVVASGFEGGHNGRYIVEEVKKLGIEPAFVRVDAETRTCINIYDPKKKTQTEFLEPGAEVTALQVEAFLKQFSALVERSDMVTASGSVPQGIGIDIYQKMAVIAKAAGKEIIVDTSGELLVEAVKAKPLMIKPNTDEIKLLCGMEVKTTQDMITAAKEIHKSGVSIVVISLGEQGSLMVCEDGVYRARVPKVDAENTVGCGDSMVAGFAVGLTRGYELPEILRFASAISAASAMCVETGVYRQEDMDALYADIKIDKIEC